MLRHPNFPYKRTSLYNIIVYLEYPYGGLDNRLRLKSTERIRHLTNIYLARVARVRAEGRVVVYLDETWYDTHDVKKKGFRDGSIDCTLPHSVPSKGKRILVLHAGNEDGYLDGCLLLSAKNIADANADFHKDMNAERFEKWVREQLLPSLARRHPGRGCAIVMDNAPYHSRRDARLKHPIKKSNRAELFGVLFNHDIPVPPSNRPSVPTNKELLDAAKAAIVQRHIPQAYVVVDNYVAQKGHLVRLPPYFCEFNPIELSWSLLKRLVLKHNTSIRLGASVVELLRQMERRVTPEHWRKFCEHTINEENRHRNAPQHAPVIVPLNAIVTVTSMW